MSMTKEIEVENAANPRGNEIIDLMMTIISDGLDHPEVWNEIPYFLTSLPDFSEALEERQHVVDDPFYGILLSIIAIVAMASKGQIEEALQSIDSIAAKYCESELVQGALRHIQNLENAVDAGLGASKSA